MRLYFFQVYFLTSKYETAQEKVASTQQEVGRVTYK
jgi:hypothetical protein